MSAGRMSEQEWYNRMRNYGKMGIKTKRKGKVEKYSIVGTVFS